MTEPALTDEEWFSLPMDLRVWAIERAQSEGCTHDGDLGGAARAIALVLIGKPAIKEPDEFQEIQQPSESEIRDMLKRRRREERGLA